jgi:hypothetical protein
MATHTKMRKALLGIKHSNITDIAEPPSTSLRKQDLEPETKHLKRGVYDFRRSSKL